ncbi:hypothetical protein [Kribbella sp. DT2]|uniref:hypothetical protein n=1 Tax=Kribbella sp. DT2 TaxID=3393427 RepID=UPI003CF77DFE
MTDPTTGTVAPAAASVTGLTTAPADGPTTDRHQVEGHLLCARRHLLAAHRQRHRLTAHRHLRYARRHLLAAHPGALQYADLHVPATPGPTRATRRHLTPYRISCPARHSLPGARHLRLPCHRSLSACRRLQRAHRQLRQLQRGATRGLE